MIPPSLVVANFGICLLKIISAKGGGISDCRSKRRSNNLEYQGSDSRRDDLVNSSHLSKLPLVEP